MQRLPGSTAPRAGHTSVQTVTTVVDARDLRPPKRRVTHAAGPRGSVDLTAAQVARAQLPAGVAHGLHLGMGGWIAVHDDAARPFANDPAQLHDDRPERLIAPPDGALLLLEGERDGNLASRGSWMDRITRSRFGLASGSDGLAAHHRRYCRKLDTHDGEQPSACRGCRFRRQRSAARAARPHQISTHRGARPASSTLAGRRRISAAPTRLQTGDAPPVTFANPLTELNLPSTLSSSASVHHLARQGGRCGDRSVHDAVASARAKPV